MPANPSPLKPIMEFFGMSAKEMMTEWKQLTPKDKEEISSGIQSGSLTY
jgi:hypothetical protein